MPGHKMELRHASALPLENPEIVLNLWAYSGEDGTILRLAGKTYAMQGTDADKLAVLRQLAKTDFLSASWDKVPENFKIHHAEFGYMKAAALASMLGDSQYHSLLFGPLIEQMAESIPEQLCVMHGEYTIFRLDIPEDLLCVSTLVIEKEDGSLVPMVAD